MDKAGFDRLPATATEDFVDRTTDLQSPMHTHALPGWSPWKEAKWQLVFGQLLAACYFAHDVQQPIWEFAVEIEYLKAIGLTANDLRWLSAKGYTDHAVEFGNSPNRRRRRFRRRSSLGFRKRSCVVLTEAGIVFARHVYRPPHELASNSDVDAHFPILSVDMPYWDQATRMLWFGSKVIKRFKLPAPNQERILAAMQEEGWPMCIDDPLPPTAGVDSKRRLHDTVNRLNRSHENHLIRFAGNGNGLAIHWQLVPTSASSAARAAPVGT